MDNETKEKIKQSINELLSKTKINEIQESTIQNTIETSHGELMRTNKKEINNLIKQCIQDYRVAV